MRKRNGTVRKAKRDRSEDFGRPIIWTLPEDELARLFKSSPASKLKHPVRIIPEMFEESVGGSKT